MTAKNTTSPKMLTWRGKKVYRCRMCQFDTLEEAKFIDHVARVHPPFRIIDGGKTETPPKPTDNQKKEGK